MKPMLETLEDRLSPAVLHAIGEDFSLRGTTLYARGALGTDGGHWSASLFGVRSAVVADGGQVVDALLVNNQVVSSILGPGGRTPWSLTLVDVSRLHCQEELAIATLESGKLRFNDYRLGPAAPWRQSLTAPALPWEISWAKYTSAQKQYIETKVHQALSGLPAGSSDFLKAAALTSFIYQWVHRSGDLLAENGYGVLMERGAVCGGMSETVAEMLLSIGIPARPFFEVGGKNPAHSMLEAQFSDGTRGILDPYYGVVYYDLKLHRPVGVADLPRYLASGAPCSYLCKLGDYLGNPSRDPPVQPMQTFLGSYALTTSNPLTIYSYPGVFTESAQRHLSYDGIPVTVDVPLRPGTVLGHITWQPASRTARPWDGLSGTTLNGSVFLSWVYLLGLNNEGFAQHTYHVRSLTPGQHYRLTLIVANAGALPNLAPNPVVQFWGAGPLHQVQLRNRFWQPGRPYRPQLATLDFTAQGKTATIHASALGSLVLAGIGLRAV